MKPDDTGNNQGGPRGAGRERGAAGGEAGHHPDGVSATNLLVELAQCQRGIRALLHAALASMEPIAKQVLPSVSFTLTGLIHATEVAANKVLDQAEQLASDRDRLGKALARLEPYVSKTDPASRRAWTDVTECSQTLATRLVGIMSAMAFQDLTTQHLAGAIKAVDETREQLTEVLVMLDLPVQAEEPEAQLKPGTSVNHSSDGASRQALADQLWAEMRER
jgi:chemotaxis regulatin CheY-phosphate phosphatase CheZ